MPKASEITEITTDSIYADIIAFQGGRFRNLTKDVVEATRKNFKILDTDSNGYLDFHEVSIMFEKLGLTKTAKEVREYISFVDIDDDGLIDFPEMLQMLAGPPEDQQGGEPTELANLGRIASGNLGNHANFFEKAAHGTKDVTDENREKIKRDYEERKKIEAMRKAELDREKEEAEEKARAQAEARSRLAAKAALFDSK